MRKIRTCSVEGCGEKHRRNGYCNTHSSRVRRHDDPLKVKLEMTHRGHIGCTAEGCNRDHYAKGLCKSHSYKMYSKTPKGYQITKAARKKYDQTEKGKIANILKRQRRRALSKDHVQLTAKDVLDIRKSFNHQCFKCGCTHDLQLDHHIPLNKGGKLTKDNTVILCLECNGTKSDLLPKDYYTEEELSLLKSKHHI